MTITEEIQHWKKKRNAVILAHYYVSEAVQELADYVGDSFYLSKIAVGLKETTIVFCGVSFMGESAKILNPHKTVLMPDATADCAMAHMATPETIQAMREKYEDLAVVCYINSTAELKRHSDVCVTSANAVQIVRSLSNHHIFFIPDRNLARFVAQQVPEKHIVLNEGYCPIHEQIALQQVQDLKKVHPSAKILVHPECPQAVCDLADYIGSTSGIIAYATANPAEEFIVCTEIGVDHELKKRNPGKKFYFPKTEPVCHDMKSITPEKILQVLKTGENEVSVDESLRESSKKPLEMMLELTGK